MELNQLRHFHTVASVGSFSAGAKKMRIAQSAVSIAIKKLECDLGIQLFNRAGRKAVLTKDGNDLFRKCELIFSNLEEFENSLKHATNADVSGPLNFGAAEVISSHFVPSILNAVLKKHARIYPQVTTSTATHLLDQVRSRSLEFALLFHSPELSGDLEFKIQIPLEFKLVVLSKMKNSNAVCSSFIGSREIDDVPVKSYPTLKKLRSRYPNAQIRISTNSLNAHKKFVELGMGCAILPKEFVNNEIKSGIFHCLFAKDKFVFNLKIITRRGELLSKPSQVFIDHLTQYFKVV